MIKNNFLKDKIINLKYFKNNCVVKYKIIQKKRFNGEKVSLIDFLVEMGFIKKKEIKKETKKSNINKPNDDTKKYDIKEEKVKNKIINRKIIYNTASIAGFILISFLTGIIFFEKSNDIRYLKLTEENEIKISNILKSPKTSTYIKNTYNEKSENIEYFFLVVDNLDSYSYKIRLNDTSEDLRKELLQNNLKNTTTTNSLEKINATTIIPFEDSYLINNKYNIDKSLLNDSTLDKIENNIKMESINNYNHFKNLTITSITVVLSILLNIIYFSTKKIISKKKVISK